MLNGRLVGFTPATLASRLVDKLRILKIKGVKVNLIILFTYLVVKFESVRTAFGIMIPLSTPPFITIRLLL